MLQVGIVGLPNVGKSTLFNALTAQEAALAANYPFATIEPNVGIVAVPDERLPVLEKLNKAQKIVPATVEFVDIAGLVKGASKGEGLGNKFLANIRETDAVVQVVRCFEDENIHHVEGSVEAQEKDVDHEAVVLHDKPSELESSDYSIGVGVVHILVDNNGVVLGGLQVVHGGTNLMPEPVVIVVKTDLVGKVVTAN